jgi:hypothetical protein
MRRDGGKGLCLVRFGCSVVGFWGKALLIPCTVGRMREYEPALVVD